MTDPIDKPGFNVYRPREPNPDRMARIRDMGLERKQFQELADQVTERLIPEVKEAHKVGHSLRQLADVLDVSLGTIQRMVREER